MSVQESLTLGEGLTEETEWLRLQQKKPQIYFDIDNCKADHMTSFHIPQDLYRNAADEKVHIEIKQGKPIIFSVERQITHIACALPGLIKKSSLRELYLSHDFMLAKTDDDRCMDTHQILGSLILKLLDAIPSLEKLELGMSKLSSDAVIEISKTKSTSLRHLDLRDCKIDISGVKSLARFLLSDTCRLTILDLRDNVDITDASLRILVEALCNKTKEVTLEKSGLKLDYKNFDIVSLTQLFEAIINVYLTGIEVSICEDDAKLIDKFASSLTFNNYLQDIRVGESAPIQIQALKSKTEFILRLDNDGSVYKRINLQIQLSIQKHNLELNKIEFQIPETGNRSEHSKDRLSFIMENDLNIIIDFLSFRASKFGDDDNLRQIMLDEKTLDDNMSARLYNTHHISLDTRPMHIKYPKLLTNKIVDCISNWLKYHQNREGHLSALSWSTGLKCN